jgi:hypothetical protein
MFFTPSPPFPERETLTIHDFAPLELIEPQLRKFSPTATTSSPGHYKPVTTQLFN